MACPTSATAARAPLTGAIFTPALVGGVQSGGNVNDQQSPSPSEQPQAEVEHASDTAGGRRSPTHAANPSNTEIAVIGGIAVVIRVAILVGVTASIIAILRLGVLPIVEEVAGENTTFEFSFVVNISIALNIMLGVALTFSEVGRRRANKELRESTPPID